MKTRKIIFGSGLLFIGVLAGLLLAVKFDILPSAQSQSPKQETKASPNTVKPASAEPIVSSEAQKMEDAIIKVAATSGKAVVSISTEHTTKMGGASRRFYFGGNTPFGGEGNPNQFFDDFFGGEMPNREFKQKGLGSGVIIDDKGYILTNEHVVGEADKISVTLPDGREFKGELKGKDSRSDLAIIKIDATNLPVAKLGDSDNLKSGQWVIAVGNPFGFALDNTEPTVTVGVISALHRSLGRYLSRDRDYGDLIQTDAAINPGNSGGPLVNLKGEVVGINVAIFSTSGGYQGVGFAIPINSAKRIISRLIEGKKILYGWLGVTVQDLTDDMAKYFGLPDKNGVLVTDALEEGPAKKSGLKEGDCIKEFDGKQITSVKDLIGLVSQTEVGKKVKLIAIRDKKPTDFIIEVGQRPDKIGQGQESEDTGSADNWRGIKVEDLNSEKFKRFGIKEKKGVIVTEVEPDSLAEAAEIMPRDIILEINKQPVNNLSDYQNITKGTKGDALVKTNRGYFLIKSGG